jgi:hypothetical protein
MGTRYLIVDDQDFGIQNFGCANHSLSLPIRAFLLTPIVADYVVAALTRCGRVKEELNALDAAASGGSVRALNVRVIATNERESLQ